MTKPFTLKPVRNYRRKTIKSCATCKHLTFDGVEVRCARPVRTANGSRPIWYFTIHLSVQDLLQQAGSSVCDRWIKKPDH